MMESYGNVWSHRAKWAYMLLIVLALMLPLFYIIYISFNEFGFGATKYEFTWRWYGVLLSNAELLGSLKWSVYLGLATVFTAVPMSLLAAKHYKRTQHKVAFVALALLPLFTPGDIIASSLLVYFKNLNRGIEWLGAQLSVNWFEGWFDLGFFPALVGLILWTFPYAFIVILITMSRYRQQQTDAARSCGATAWQAFWQIEFPQIRVGVFASSAFVFILCFNEFARTNALKGGFNTFMTVMISHMMNTGMSEDSYAMASVMSVLSMLIIGSILLYTLIRVERMEREARALAHPPGSV